MIDFLWSVIQYFGEDIVGILSQCWCSTPDLTWCLGEFGYYAEYCNLLLDGLVDALDEVTSLEPMGVFGSILNGVNQAGRDIISLKQGLGRLIRKSSDKGLLSVLDTRIMTSRYGRFFLDSLPKIPISHDLSDINRFFE